MAVKARKLGAFFEEKYGKDPRKLTLEEINDIATGKNGKGYKTTRNVITTRGSIFKSGYYDIEELFDKAIEK